MLSATAGRVASITGRDRSESTWSPCQSMCPPAGCGHVPLVARYPFYRMTGARNRARACRERLREPDPPGRTGPHDAGRAEKNLPTVLSMQATGACRTGVGPIGGPDPGGNEMAQYLILIYE